MKGVGHFSSVARILEATPCPGIEFHKQPIWHREDMFGLVRKVVKYYPETMTTSTWHEYIGPEKKLLLLIALWLVPEKRLWHNGKWIFSHGIRSDISRAAASFQQ
jgi:hypothetical protein